VPPRTAVQECLANAAGRADTQSVSHSDTPTGPIGRLPKWLMVPLTVLAVGSSAPQITVAVGCFAVGSAVGAVLSLLAGDVRNLAISTGICALSCGDLALVWQVYRGDPENRT
jgi:Ca2+/Na+ antiporter